MILTLIAVVTACSSASLPFAPATSSAATPTPSPTPPPIVPGVAPPAGTYVFTDTGLNVASWTRRSRFILGDDGRFVLRYEGSGVYRGTYRYSDGILTFEWEGWSIAGPWGATGSFRDDVLTVTFNIVMQLSDFENASYKRVP